MRSIQFAFAAALSALVATPAAASNIFHFQFDNRGLVSGDGSLSRPLVGSGTFTSLANLAPGTYNLSSLTRFSLDFHFTNGTSYTTSGITTLPTGVAVRITALGGGHERLFFTEGSGAGRTAVRKQDHSICATERLF